MIYCNDYSNSNQPLFILIGTDSLTGRVTISSFLSIGAAIFFAHVLLNASAPWGVWLATSLFFWIGALSTEIFMNVMEDMRRFKLECWLDLRPVILENGEKFEGREFERDYIFLSKIAILVLKRKYKEELADNRFLYLSLTRL